MFRSLGWLESNERYLHRQESSQGIDSTVSSVDPVAELSSNHKNEDMERDQVDQKDISTPGAEHVEECDSTETGPVDITTLDPEAVSEEHTKDSNTFTAS